MNKRNFFRLSLIFLVALAIVFTIILVTIPAVSATTIYGTVFDTDLNQATNVRVTVNTMPEQQIIAVSGRYSVNVDAGSYTLIFEQLDGDIIQARASEEIVVADEGSFVRDVLLLPHFGDEEEIMSEIDAITIQPLEQPAQVNNFIILLLVVVVFVVLFLVYRVNKLLRSFKSNVLDKDKKNTGTPVGEGGSKPIVENKVHESTIQKENSTNGDITAVAKVTPDLKSTSTSLIQQSVIQKLPDDLQMIIDFVRAQEGRATQKEVRKHMPQSEAKVSLMLADLVQRGVVTKIKKGRGNIIVLTSHDDFETKKKT